MSNGSGPYQTGPTVSLMRLRLCGKDWISWGTRRTADFIRAPLLRSQTSQRGKMQMQNDALKDISLRGGAECGRITVRAVNSVWRSVLTLSSLVLSFIRLCQISCPHVGSAVCIAFLLRLVVPHCCVCVFPATIRPHPPQALAPPPAPYGKVQLGRQWPARLSQRLRTPCFHWGIRWPRALLMKIHIPANS